MRRRLGGQEARTGCDVMQPQTCRSREGSGRAPGRVYVCDLREEKEYLLGYQLQKKDLDKRCSVGRWDMCESETLSGSGLRSDLMPYW